MDKTQRQPMAKRLLSILFAITLVMGLVPLSAYAAIGEAANSSDTKTEEQNAQGTEQDTAGNKATEEAEDSSASNAGTVEANEEEPAADSQDAAQNANSASNNADPYALQTADNGISVAADESVVYGYNGAKTPTVGEIFSFLKAKYPYHDGAFDNYPYSKYTLSSGKSNEYDITESSTETFSGSLSSNYSLKGTYKHIWTETEKLGTFSFQKQWDTSFATTPTGTGAITKIDGSSFDGNKDTSNDGNVVQFKVQKVDGQEVNVVRYDKDGTSKLADKDQPVFVEEVDGYLVYKITADQNSTVKAEYKAPTASLNAAFANATVSVEGSSLISGENSVGAGKALTAVVTPEGNYAVTSVKLSGGEGKYKYDNVDLLENATFSNCVATISIPELGKDMTYKLEIETTECKLQLKNEPSAAVKGLSEKALIKQRVIDGVLDLKNSFPAGIAPNDLKIEYLAVEATWITDEKWLDISESYRWRSFGDKDIEKIRITYTDANGQYRTLEIKDISVKIEDGRTATSITTEPSVSVKYVSDKDALKSDIKTALAAKVIDEDTKQQIDGADVDFDFDHKVGTQTITIKYAGSEGYKSSETKAELTIAKGDAKVTVNSQNITYGEKFTTPLVSADPSDAWPVYAIVGIDGTGSSYVSIDLGILSDSIKKYLPTVEVSPKEFLSVLNSKVTRPLIVAALNKALNIDNGDEIVSDIIKVLENVEKYAPGVMDSKFELGGTPSEAGVYAVFAVSANPNYNTDVAVGYLTIAPATQNVELRFKNELPGFTMTVDQVKKFDFSAGLFQGDLDITEKGNVSSKFIGTDYAGNVYSSTEAPTEPGLYSQVVSNFGGNYSAKTISRQFRIARVETEMTISFDGTTNPEQSVVYTGSKVVPTYTVTSGGKELDPSSVQVMYWSDGKILPTYGLPTEAGTYTVLAAYPGTSYYGGASAKCTLTIKRQSIEEDSVDYRGVTVSNIEGVVYDGDEHVLVPEVKDANGSDLVRTKDYLIHYDTTDFTNSGKVTVIVTGINNYTGTVTRTYQINPATAVVNTDSATKYYDGEPLTAGGRITLVGDETATVVTSDSQTDVGTKPNKSYTIDWNGTAKAGNYNVVDGTFGTLEVKAQSIVLDPENPDSYKGVEIDTPENIVFNGEKHQWTPTVGYEDGTKLVEGKDYTVTYERNDVETDDFTSAGTIDVTITGIGNYTGTVNKAYAINKQSINPEYDNYLGVQIDTPSNVTYDAKDHQWAPTVTAKDGTELVEGEDYTVNYLRGTEDTNDFTNAGEITVVIEGIGNYVRTVERTYTIEKAAIQVTDSATKEYNGQEQMFYVQATDAKGLAEDEVLTLSDAQVKGTEPGVYTEVSDYTWSVVKADGKTDSTGNYTIQVSGTLTITSADSGAAAADDGSNAKAGKGTAPQTGDATAPFAAGAAFAAAAALAALFASRRFRRIARR